MSEEKEGMWVKLELMGHRQFGCYLTEVEMYGTALARADIYDGDAEEPFVTQFYSSSAIYCITPITEDLARRMGAGSKPRPVSEYELPAPRLFDKEGKEWTVQGNRLYLVENQSQGEGHDEE